MPRLIDADALGICKAKRELFEKPEYADGWNSAIEIIENAKTIDAVPVVHGRWIWNETGKPDWEQFYTCSNCGDPEYWESHFCPNCGAKMDLDNKNQEEKL